MEEYWDHVALEATNLKTLRLEKWRKSARNWLADYADKRAYDFISNVVNQVAKVSTSARVLDVGCGPGKWSMLFAERFDSITGVDISPKMILLARENAEKRGLTNVEFHVMDASKLHFADGKYDFVNCVTVLQHILDDVDWKRAVGEIARVTKPGGSVLLFEMAPNFAVRKHTAHLSIRTMRQYVEEFGKAGAHLVYWRAADLSLPVTVVGLKSYAASFNKRVYYFMSERRIVPTGFLSFLSWVATMLAGIIDYRLAETPLSFLSVGRILLFRKSKARLHSKSETEVSLNFFSFGEETANNIPARRAADEMPDRPTVL